MLTFTIKFDQQQVVKEIREGSRDLIREVAFAIEAEMKLLMTGPKSGREYRQKGGIIHQASAPGEAPAVDTSNLIGSIDTRIISDSEAVISIPVEYAEALEFGAPKRGLAPRPFVRPAVDGVLRRFGQGGILASARN